MASGASGVSMARANDRRLSKRDRPYDCIPLHTSYRPQRYSYSAFH